VSDALDDSTVAYVLAARPHFERLRDVAAQLAGILILAASGARSADPDHPMLHSAETLFRESQDGIRSTRSTERARQHHRHLARAADSIEAALACARDRLGRSSGHADLDSVLTPLKVGYTHLQQAANALPGFELVNFEHACCGAGRLASMPAGLAHPPLPARPEQRRP
jgi:hypothetical protein